MQSTLYMYVKNAESQMRKGILELCILNLLKHREAYASEILSELKASKMIVVEGTIYPLLTRLSKSGILTYRWEESTNSGPRKYYGLTTEGREIQKKLDATWQDLVSAVSLTESSRKKANKSKS
jgi:PadR family transcriptional regulator PadR